MIEETEIVRDRGDELCLSAVCEMVDFCTMSTKSGF